MKTLKFLSIVILSIFLTTALNSCKGEDGADGVDGVDGAQGPQGSAGQDGNANVQTYVFTNPTWGSDFWMDINMNGILTDDVIQNDVILGYVKPEGFDLVNPIPGNIASSPDDKDIKVNIFDSNSGVLDGVYRLVSYNLDGSFTAHASLQELDWVKVIIIESTNTTSTTGNGKMSPKQQILNQLANAGVDVNDYYAVCDYYGLDY